MTATYVYDGKEWVITGREAVQTLKSGKKRILYEIRPVDVPEEQKTYNRWVHKEDLYHVEE